MRDCVTRETWQERAERAEQELADVLTVLRVLAVFADYDPKILEMRVSGCTLSGDSTLKRAVAMAWRTLELGFAPDIGSNEYNSLWDGAWEALRRLEKEGK